MKKEMMERKWKVKGPDKKQIGGIEENNVHVPVGGSHLIPKEFAPYLSFTV